MTEEGLGRCLTAFRDVEDCTLGVAGAITDAMLASLHGCSQLQHFQPGDNELKQPNADLPAAAVSRSVSRHWLVVSETGQSRPE